MASVQSDVLVMGVVGCNMDGCQTNVQETRANRRRSHDH